MANRGRKSLADLALGVVPLDPTTGRPRPPEDVRGLQADIWRSIVDDMPRGWFSAETHELLRGLCRHAFAARKIGDQYTALLEAGPPAAGEGVGIYWEAVEQLGIQHARETAAMAALAGKLRVSKVSRQTPYADEREKRSAAPGVKKLWEPGA
jgi:hypothetical protein